MLPSFPPLPDVIPGDLLLNHNASLVDQACETSCKQEVHFGALDILLPPSLPAHPIPRIHTVHPIRCVSFQLMFNAPAFATVRPQLFANDAKPVFVSEEVAFRLTSSGTNTNLGFNVLFTTTQCPKETYYAGIDESGTEKCVACPVGGSCTGGGRVVPLPGYWSDDPFAPPRACPNPDACIGGTSNACAKGYEPTSVLSAECLAPGFYKVGSACFTCGSTASEYAQLAVQCIALSVLLSLLSIGIARFGAVRVSGLTLIFAAVQLFATVGKVGAEKLPESLSFLHSVVQYLQLLNFDVQSLVKPGCTVSRVSFSSQADATFGFNLLALFVLVGCGAFYADQEIKR